MISRRNSVEFKRNHLLVEHRDQPANGTNKEFATLPPIHVLGPINRIDFFRKRLRKDIASVAAFLSNGSADILALRSGYFLQLRYIDSRFLGKSLCRWSWLTIFKCDARRRAGDLLCDIRLRIRNSS